jgi:peptidoglycan/LPS O-acetylase OafA/YrhL
MSHAKAVRIPSLDGIRAISITIVLMAHASHTRYFPWPNWRFNALGSAGVRVFFVLSGFLITSLLMSEQKRSGRISLRNFYLRRAFRIMPVFYVYLLFITALAIFRFIKIPGRDLTFAYLYLSNFRPRQFHLVSQLWSLSVEEQFYLVWPAMMALTWTRLKFWAPIVAVCVAPALRYYMAGNLALEPYVDQSTFTVCDILATGCLLALHRERLHQSAIYRALITRTSAVGLLVFACLLIESEKFGPHYFQVTQTLLTLALALIIDACMVHAPKTLNSKAIIQVGTWSYSIYLWHVLFCVPNGARWWNLFPVNIFLSIVVAYASYRTIELPVLALRARMMGSETPLRVREREGVEAMSA